MSDKFLPFYRYAFPVHTYNEPSGPGSVASFSNDETIIQPWRLPYWYFLPLIITGLKYNGPVKYVKHMLGEPRWMSPMLFSVTFDIRIFNSSIISFHASLWEFDGRTHCIVNIYRTFSLTTGFYSYTYTFSVCFIGFIISSAPGPSFSRF